MKPVDRIGQHARISADRCGNPRMSQLQQQCTACSEKQSGFFVEPPHHRARAEYARAVVCTGLANDPEFVLEIDFARGRERVQAWSSRGQFRSDRAGHWLQPLRKSSSEWPRAATP